MRSTARASHSANNLQRLSLTAENAIFQLGAKRRGFVAFIIRRRPRLVGSDALRRSWAVAQLSGARSFVLVIYLFVLRGANNNCARAVS